MCLFLPKDDQAHASQTTWEGDPDFLTNPVDDIGFVKALVANLTSTYCIDTGRMMASGMSNGGGFTNVLACDPITSVLFAAFAAHSGANYPTTLSSSCGTDTPYTELTNTLVQSTCSPGRANVPYIEFHGDVDTQIAYYGGSHRGYCLPAIPHLMTDWYVSYLPTHGHLANSTTGRLGTVTRVLTSLPI